MAQIGFARNHCHQGRSREAVSYTHLDVYKRQVIVDVPKQVGQENQEGGKAAEPDPGIEQDAALRGQEKADDNAEAEDSDGILFFHAEAGDDADPEPVAWVGTFDGEDGEVGAAHPEVGFEAVRAEQASIGEVLWRNDDGDCTCLLYTSRCV